MPDTKHHSCQDVKGAPQDLKILEKLGKNVRHHLIRQMGGSGFLHRISLEATKFVALIGGGRIGHAGGRVFPGGLIYPP
jgi:hypothetical protein